MTPLPPPPLTTGIVDPGGQWFASEDPFGRRRRPKERAIRIFLAACGLVSILTTAGIILTLAFEAIEFFREVPVWSFLTGTKWSALIRPKTYGVLPLVTGTLMISGIAGLVGIPLGVGTAIYLSEYARPRTRNTLKPILEIVAGIPTVVLGYFALTFVTPVVVRTLFPETGFYNALSPGIVVGIMIVPIIASVSEDAMAAVPRSLREGAYGLGATRVTVASRVVAPAALSGIMAAIILGLSRAIGETMIVAIGAGFRARMCANPLEGCQTLTGFIVEASIGDTPQTSIEFKAIFAVGVVLFLMTLALNIVSQRLVRRFRQVY